MQGITHKRPSFAMKIKLKSVVDDNQFIRGLLRCFENTEFEIGEFYRSANGGRVWRGGTFTLTKFRLKTKQIRFTSASLIDLFHGKTWVSVRPGYFLDHLHWLKVSVILNDFMDTQGINGDILSWFNFRVNNKRRVIYRAKHVGARPVMSEKEMKGDADLDFVDTTSCQELPYPSIQIKSSDWGIPYCIIPISPFVSHADILKEAGRI